jgi:hypothetical protein
MMQPFQLRAAGNGRHLQVMQMLEQLDLFREEEAAA